MSDILSSMGIDPGIILIILLILVVILLVCLISVNLRVQRLEHKYKVFMKGSKISGSDFCQENGPDR